MVDELGTSPLTVVHAGAGVYDVASETVPRRRYRVHVAGGRGTCTCPGWESHHTDCKHVRAVLEAEMTGAAGVGTTALTTAEAPPPALLVDTLPTALLPSRADIDLMAMIANEVITGSGAVPDGIKTVAQAIAVMLAGWELGLRPMSALRHLFIVNGRTELETRAMVGVIKARRPDVEFAWPEYRHDAVTCVVRRPGQPAVEVRYTREDAQRSGQLAKPGPWQKYTRDMLYAAATKRACRIACPDLINAIEQTMHTAAEARALVLPEAAPRIVEGGEIPAEAYNTGDLAAPPDTSGEAAAVPATAQPYASAEEAAARATAARRTARRVTTTDDAAETPRVRLRRSLQAQKAALAPDDFAALLAVLAGQFPQAASADHTSLVIGRLTDAEVLAACAAVDARPGAGDGGGAGVGDGAVRAG